MTHVGDVHDMRDSIPVINQNASENIFENIGAQIPDMGIIVNRRSAGIQSNLTGFDRLEFFLLACQRIVKKQFHGWHSLQMNMFSKKDAKIQ